MPRRRLILSPHFKVSEFRDWHTGKLPPAYMDRQLAKLCREVLEPLRKVFGICHVHSGYRDQLTNFEVGGVEHSFHVYTARRRAPAADVSFARGTPQEWARAADRLLPDGGLGVYPTHIHVDQRGSRARW